MTTSKKKTARIGGLVLALLALIMINLIPGVAVRAAAAESTGDIGFYVQAVLPENQTDDTLTYFDLAMKPGQTQQLEVEVVNESDAAITVDVQAISASTNRNGVIDYKTPGIRDVTLLHPFSELASIAAGSLRIGAGETAVAQVTLTMPAEAYDGVVLGGLVFTRRPEGGAGESTGMTLQNVYSYVIGVKLSETGTPVRPDFELVSVAAEAVNYQPGMVHSIRNKAAAIAKGVDLHVVIRDSAGQLVADLTRENIDMAPNSVMPLAVTPGMGVDGSPNDTNSQPDGQLAPGDYISEVTLMVDDQSWRFEQKFTVGSIEAQQINAELPAASIKPAAQSSPLMIALLSSAGVIILGLVIVILLLTRRRKQAEAEKRREARQTYYRRNRIH